ncbi:ThiF family adenylyltransferase [Patescibacteria group bacterium]|nr:ThiF family adenylyltransferase [Patescibacteria group bacterium]
MQLNQPTIFREGEYTEEDLLKFKRKEKIWEEVDIYSDQLRELFEIQNPKLAIALDLENKLNDFVRSKEPLILKGNWVFFPWTGKIVHMLGEKDYYDLRTNRNKLLITTEEQEKLYQTTVGVVGLSVGSSIVKCLTSSAIANSLKLAEYDIIETSNLNRIQAGVDKIGRKKMDILCQQVYEVNPYAKLFLYADGLEEKNIDEFLSGTPKPKLIFEIIDDFEMKIKLRLAAREAGVPVVMFSNLGDRVLVDIERYDLDDKLSLFNGLLGDLPEKMLENPDKTNEKKNEYAVKLAGKDNIPERAIDSVKKIGEELVGRPQLMSTVSVVSGLATYITRRIILGDTSLKGRILINFDNLFK